MNETPEREGTGAVGCSALVRPRSHGEPLLARDPNNSVRARAASPNTVQPFAFTSTVQALVLTPTMASNGRKTMRSKSDTSRSPQLLNVLKVRHCSRTSKPAVSASDVTNEQNIVANISVMVISGLTFSSVSVMPPQESAGSLMDAVRRRDGYTDGYTAVELSR
jgi:hypothetical protein